MIIFSIVLLKNHQGNTKGEIFNTQGKEKMSDVIKISSGYPQVENNSKTDRLILTDINGFNKSGCGTSISEDVCIKGITSSLGGGTGGGWMIDGRMRL